MIKLTRLPLPAGERAQTADCKPRHATTRNLAYWPCLSRQRSPRTRHRQGYQLEWQSHCCSPSTPLQPQPCGLSPGRCAHCCPFQASECERRERHRTRRCQGACHLRPRGYPIQRAALLGGAPCLQDELLHAPRGQLLAMARACRHVRRHGWGVSRMLQTCNACRCGSWRPPQGGHAHRQHHCH